MVPAVEPPTGCAVPDVPPPEPAGSPAVVAGPGYFAIAWAGVAPLMTASVRAIVTLVPGPMADDAFAAEPVLNSLRLHAGVSAMP